MSSYVTWQYHKINVLLLCCLKLNPSVLIIHYKRERNKIFLISHEFLKKKFKAVSLSCSSTAIISFRLRMKRPKAQITSFLGKIYFCSQI